MSFGDPHTQHQQDQQDQREQRHLQQQQDRQGRQTRQGHQPDRTVRSARALALAALLGLIALGLAWELWLAPTGSGTLALKVLPLLPCVAGLLRHRMYTFRWLSLLLWLYVLEGVVRATSEHGLGRVLALVEISLSVLLFAACALYVRWRLRNAAALPAGAPATAGQASTA